MKEGIEGKKRVEMREERAGGPAGGRLQNRD